MCAIKEKKKNFHSKINDNKDVKFTLVIAR